MEKHDMIGDNSTIWKGLDGGFCWRGNEPLPEEPMPGVFLVSNSGELHLGMGDGSFLLIGITGEVDLSKVQKEVANLGALL